MSEKSIFLDGVFLDPERLFRVLPRRIPARVKTVLRESTIGFVHVLIPALYPDGQPMDDIYCRNLNGAVAGDEILVEWEAAPERERNKRNQPDLIQASRAIRVKSAKVDQAIREYEKYIGAEIQERLEVALQQLQEDRKRVADSVERRVAQELAARGTKLDAYRDELEQRKQDLSRKESELRAAEAALDDTVSRLVEEQTAKRTLELDKREAILKSREDQLGIRQSDLEDQERTLQARWKTLVQERASFEEAGGRAYMEHLTAIGMDDADTAPQPIQASDEGFDPDQLAAKLGKRGYHIAPDLLSQAVIAAIAAWSSGQFVVLAGPTGVGKTQLVRQLAGVLGGGHGLVSVRPGWVDPADLFGFFNPMHRLFEPAPAIDHFVRAQRYTDADRLYLLCLDEMNLSRVENYAADLLSRLEMVSAGQQPAVDLYSADIARRLHDEQEKLLQDQSKLDPSEAAYLNAMTRQLQLYPSRFSIPHGLVLFGTVNVDETTQMFSPKFLDRAYVLRFPPVTLPEATSQPPFEGEASSPLWPLTIPKAEELLRIDGGASKMDDIWGAFVEWQTAHLSPLGVHLGYRFYANFLRYTSVGLSLGLDNYTSLADGYFLAKIPPRIRFNPDERAVGEADTTKMDVLQAWIEQDESLQPYNRLRKSLQEMVERSEARGMVEYWD
jgi:energy-coupling factor transporter ATP-binding protein EcfA2